jgi:uncharacterized protein YbjT (DUF2867 family)
VPREDDRWVLVFGGTGKQGGGAARNLLQRGWAVHAFARDPAGPAATALRALGATIVPGNLDDVDSVRAAMRGAYGVYSVQTPLGPGGVPAEERHGCTIADVAAEVGVTHFVHSSVGGAQRPEGVFWREAKLRIEERIRKHDLPATFLRPTYFMDNLDQYPPLLEGGTLVYRRGLQPGRSLQMIASGDIGFFAAAAFDDPATIGTKLELAGDELTGDEIAATFERHTGIPTRYEPVPMAELERISEWQATAYSWLNRIGYTADIPALRRRFPALLTLAGWLAQTGWAPRPEHATPPAAGVPRTG